MIEVTGRGVLGCKCVNVGVWVDGVEKSDSFD
jgi:hypothetical protein